MNSEPNASDWGAAAQDGRHSEAAELAASDLPIEDASQVEQLKSLGHCTLANILDAHRVSEVASQVDQLLASNQTGVLQSEGQAYGIRNLLQIWPEVVQLAKMPKVTRFVRHILGSQAGVVRALMFDKPPGRSWTLPWHRDRTVAVRDRSGADWGAFRNPTMKAGIRHLTAPDSLLERMLTLRFSLDPMCAENGPLVVWDKSHCQRSDEDSDLNSRTEAELRTVLCNAGDVFVMRPLLAHSSLKSATATQLRRRVVHLELCSESHLGGDLEWQEFVPLLDS